MDEIKELKMQLAHVKADADYWRLAYDKLLRMMDKQDEYIRQLERQVWGGSTK